MDWEVVWSASALTEVEDAVRFIAEDSSAAAETLWEAIFAAVDVLVRFPEIGPIYEADETGQTREIACNSYRIFYRLQPERSRVNVILVWHAARREPTLPESD